MTLITAAASSDVETPRSQEHFCEMSVFPASNIGINPVEAVTGIYLIGTSRWESSLFVATLVELSRKANDSRGRWVGFEIGNADHWMTVVELMTNKFPQAPKDADGMIDVPAIIEAAASDLGSAKLIETKTVTLPVNDEEEVAQTTVVIFPTWKMVAELRNCYGGC